jgi:DNA-binding LacI/PurR family transcriptional regulator
MPLAGYPWGFVDPGGAWPYAAVIMKVTRDDVARRAGVSTATVSYVINNSRSVGEATRERVLAAVKELGYQPDIVARSLASNKTWQLAIAVADIANPFFGEIVLGFEEAAQERGYFVNIISATHNLDRYLAHIIARRIDGIFVAALPTRFDTQLLYRLVDSGIAVTVSGNRTVDRRRVSTIENDYRSAMYEAFHRLTELGHRRIAYLSGLPSDMDFDDRAAAYRDCVADFNLSAEGSRLFEVPGRYDTSMEDGRAVALRMIQAHNGGKGHEGTAKHGGRAEHGVTPEHGGTLDHGVKGLPATALICTNALMALGAQKELKTAGYRIPEDVSLLAFDNIFAEELVEPPLSCFDMRKRAFGRRAFELLEAQIADGTRHHQLNTLQYVSRGSVAAPPII